MTPPLVSFSVKLDSKSWPPIRSIGTFSVSLLSHHQEPISDAFASSSTDRWAGVEWAKTKGGNPVITGSLLWMDCDIHAEHEVGDHWIVIGKLKELSEIDLASAKGPLLYFKGQYRRLGEQRT